MKSQTEMMGNKKLSKTTRNRIGKPLQQMDHVKTVLGLEGKVKELDHSIKVNENLKTIHEQNVGKFCDIMKKTNLQIMGTEEDYHITGIEYIFSGITEEKLHT